MFLTKDPQMLDTDIQKFSHHSDLVTQEFLHPFPCVPSYLMDRINDFICHLIFCPVYPAATYIPFLSLLTPHCLYVVYRITNHMSTVIV